LGTGNNGLKLPGLGQVAILVDDLEKSMKYYEEVFGIGPWIRSEGGLDWLEVRGREAQADRKISLAQVGTVQIELIQYVGGDSIHFEFLEECGQGVHHLGFFVRDLDRRLEAAKEAGIEVLQQGRIKQKGLTVRYAYLDTTDDFGVIIEFIEGKFMGIPFPMRSPLLRWGNRLMEKLGG